MQKTFLLNVERVVIAATEAYAGRVSVDDALCSVGATMSLRRAVRTRDFRAFLSQFGAQPRSDEPLEAALRRCVNPVYLAGTIGGRRLLPSAFVIDYLVAKRGLLFLFDLEATNVL